MRSLDQIIHNVNQTTYKLDTSGVAGLLGGENAIDALETIHLYEGRRWAGWYNYPGTVTVARKFGRMANSRAWNSIFPGTNESPAVTFRLTGKPGPEYSGSFSGTRLRTTGYLGYLTAEESLRTDSPSRVLQLFQKDGTAARKTGSSATVTVIELPPQQRPRIMAGTKETYELIKVIPKSKFGPPLALLSFVPSLVSIAACILSFVGEDPLCASLILIGIVSSGISSLVLGTATLGIRAPVSPGASPPGDGLMSLEDGSIIILKGDEADVNIVTKGEFELDYPEGILSHKYHMIGISSFFLYLQFLVQLLLTPRCTFFGQIVFLVTFVASGIYHMYVASYEREMVHRELLSQVLSVQTERWTLGTRTQMAVFVCLLLGDDRPYPLKYNPDVVLTRILPNVNETAVWRYWKKKVLKELERYWDPTLPYPDDPILQAEPEGATEIDEYKQFTEQDQQLLDHLISDAWCVLKGYRKWRDDESQDGNNAEENLKSLLLPKDSLV